MSDPHRLTVQITLPNGQQYRWAPDERDTINVPTGLTFSTSIPGGFSTAQLTLPRGVLDEHPDEVLFADVKITGPGGQVAWEGRVATLPREHGQSRQLTVGAVGWSAHLKDFQGFREIYVSRDLTGWGDISVINRQNLLSGASLVSQGMELNPDRTGSPSIRTGWTIGTWPATDKPISEAMLDTNGIPIGELYYEWARGYNADNANPDHIWGAGLATDDTIASYDDTGDLSTSAGPGSGTLTATTDGRTVAYVYYYINAANATTENRPYDVFWDTLVIYGNHGLAKRGSEPNAGYTLSDIAADVISRAAPLLTIGEIEPTNFILTQAAYPDPTTAEAVLLDANKYELKRMGVWEDRAFYMWSATPDNRIVWEARLDEGATLQLEGDSAESVANGVIVRYTDVHGHQRTIGPTGYTPCDVTSDALLITDTANPATAAGIQKYETLSLTFQTDASGAEQIGAVWLAEQQLPQRRGSVTLTGLVRHPTEGPVPAWRVRAGDFIRIADRPGDPAREITQTGYSHDGHQVTCAVGGLPVTTEAILERVGIAASTSS